MKELEIRLGVRMRHRGPGNGSIYGPDAEVSADSYLGRDCLVFGDSDVVGSRVERDSTIGNSRLYSARVSRSCLRKCRVFSGVIQFSTLIGVTVKGGARVYGVTANAPGLRIDRGEWWRAPAWAVVGNPELRDDQFGVRVVISECVEDRFHIGCWCQTYEDWTKAGYRQRLGKYAGWTPEQVEFAYDTFTDWRLVHQERA